jgi:hypothetical protein
MKKLFINYFCIKKYCLFAYTIPIMLLISSCGLKNNSLTDEQIKEKMVNAYTSYLVTKKKSCKFLCLCNSFIFK